MKKLLILFITILIFGGCSCKPEYIYIKSKPFDFQVTPQPKVRDIRIHNKDIKLYEAYIKNFRNNIKFHNEQIKDYKKAFSKDNNSTKNSNE